MRFLGIITIVLSALMQGACVSSTPQRRPPVLGVPMVADTVRRCEPRGPDDPAIEITSARLNDAYALLMRESPTFSQEVDSVSKVSQFRIRVGMAEDFSPTYDNVAGAESRVAGIFVKGGAYTPTGTPLCDLDIVFFTSRVENLAIEAGYSETALVQDIAIILAHELYGHAFPLAFMPGVPRWPSPCRDPEYADMLVSPGCAGERENRIRADFGLPPRTGYVNAPVDFLCYMESKPCDSPESETGGGR